MAPQEQDKLRYLLEDIGVKGEQIDEFMAVYAEAPTPEPTKPAPLRSEVARVLELEIANAKDWRSRAALVAKRISWDLPDVT